MVINRMDVIIASRYAPLVIPVVLHELPTTDYMKYPLIYNEEGELSFEEYLVSFYSFVDNFNIDYSYVWMRFFE
jgi:hypothetical protein